MQYRLMGFSDDSVLRSEVSEFSVYEVYQRISGHFNRDIWSIADKYWPGGPNDCDVFIQSTHSVGQGIKTPLTRQVEAIE